MRLVRLIRSMSTFSAIGWGCGFALAAVTANGRVNLAASSAPLSPIAPQSAQAAALKRSGAALAETRALVVRFVQAGAVPGIVAALGLGDEPTHFAAAGHISFEPGALTAGPDTLWRVYSMTKPIAAAAAMILIEEGKLKLDEPLSTYLPGFEHMQVLTDSGHSLQSKPATAPITIRNLLTHTAGFAYFSQTGGEPLERDYKASGIVPLTQSRAFEQQNRPLRAPSLEEFASRLASKPLLFEPGTRWRYSIALDLTGRLIEVASGMSFDRFVQTRIFDPLGMTSSFWTVPAKDARRLATNYIDAEHNHTPLDPGATSVWLSPPSFPYGGSGLVMSARDYDVFLHMLQDGGAVRGVRIMKQETAALMMSNLLPSGVTFGGVNGTARTSQADGPTGYGAGGSVYVVPGVDGYPGAGTYGWGGAAGSFAFVDPAHHMRGVVMLNVMGGIPGLRDAAQKALIADERHAQDR